MSVWSSLSLPEPIRDIRGGGDVDVAVTDREPEHGRAVRIWRDDAGHEDCVELSMDGAARLRDALDLAIAKGVRR